MEQQPQAVHPPLRWTRHGLNNGVIFWLTVRGVRTLPRSVSYAIGHVGTWMAWRLMRATTNAVAGNLSAVFPTESTATLKRRALDTYRSYAFDVIDFLRALSAPEAEAHAMFDLRAESGQIFESVLREQRGALLVAGHFGNWEIGGVLMGRVLKLPLTIVAMPEADPAINALRRETRDRMGVETLEVRQSLETPLAIRRTLAANRVVAFLVDRHVDRDRIEVSFFGRPTWFLQTPALLAYLTAAPIIPCFLERVRPGQFTTVALPPIVVDRTLPRDAAIRQATQQMAAALESRITLKPHLWYHFYSYWDAQDAASQPTR